MRTPISTTVQAIAARRGLALTGSPPPSDDARVIVHNERTSDITLSVEGDPRMFRVYPGWVQITHPDGQVSVQRVDVRFPHTLPTQIANLAGLLAGEVWRTSRLSVPATRAAQLRFLAATVQEAGWYRTPESLYLSAGGFSFYWSCPAHWKQRGFSQAQWDRLAALSARYRRFVHYVREVSPRWREERRIEWADNSTDVVEVNRHGHRRTRQLVGPGGDACF